MTSFFICDLLTTDLISGEAATFTVTLTPLVSECETCANKSAASEVKRVKCSGVTGKVELYIQFGRIPVRDPVCRI